MQALLQSKIQYYQDINQDELKSCCQNWKNIFPNMAVLAFVTESNASNVIDIQQALNSIEIPLMGAIFPELIYDAEFKTSGVLLICLETKPNWYLQPEIPPDGKQLSHCLDNFIDDIESHLGDSNDMGLFLIFDAMLPNIATILDELFLSFGDALNYMGVNAGSETFQPMPCLFDNRKIIQNGMLAIQFEHNKGAALEHGYIIPEKTIVATSTTGNRISSIDWKPAFGVYQETIKQQYNVDITTENFYELAAHFPFGIIRADNEVLVRIPVMLDDDGSLFCVGEIPENSVLALLDAPQANSLYTVEQLASKQQDSALNLFFYCAGRRMHLCEAANKELKSFYQLMHKQFYAGALSLGEIGSASQSKYPLFHNATLVTIPLD